MTRINVVHPSILTRQHLLAEWHEIGRVITLAESGVKPEEVPEQYTLGKGHMKFFADKLGYIALRIGLIANEMRERGFKVDRRKQLDLIGRIVIVGFGKDWEPEANDMAINLERLMERSPNEAYRRAYDALFENSF